MSQQIIFFLNLFFFLSWIFLFVFNWKFTEGVKGSSIKNCWGSRSLELQIFFQSKIEQRKIFGAKKGLAIISLQKISPIKIFGDPFGVLRIHSKPLQTFIRFSSQETKIQFQAFLSINHGSKRAHWGSEGLTGAHWAGAYQKLSELTGAQIFSK